MKWQNAGWTKININIDTFSIVKIIELSDFGEIPLS